jgi:hypothetical protein
MALRLLVAGQTPSSHVLPGPAYDWARHLLPEWDWGSNGRHLHFLTLEEVIPTTQPA